MSHAVPESGPPAGSKWRQRYAYESGLRLCHASRRGDDAPDLVRRGHPSCEVRHRVRPVAIGRGGVVVRGLGRIPEGRVETDRQVAGAGRIPTELREEAVHAQERDVIRGLRICIERLDLGVTVHRRDAEVEIPADAGWPAMREREGVCRRLLRVPSGLGRVDGGKQCCGGWLGGRTGRAWRGERWRPCHSWAERHRGRGRGGDACSDEHCQGYRSDRSSHGPPTTI